jgi:NTP pyrophosphatase (non-canonical NTP hydrolase)
MAMFPYDDDQLTISQWSNATFGPAGSNLSCAARANVEMAELLFALSKDDNHPKAAEEMADVVIVLYRLAERLGVDLHDEVDKKMRINRGREWVVEGGHGQHR